MAPDDSALGPLASVDGPGLLPQYRYDALIRTAFQPAYWESALVVDGDLRVVPGATSPRGANEFTQMEANFALFWSLAIHAYESTLVSGDSRLDRFLDGEVSALTAIEQDGLRTFQGGAQCTECHQGPELTGAGITSAAGAFKSPGLRNVEYTGPYFHTGGASSLAQVVDFYARRGDFPDGPLDTEMARIRINPQDREALIAFLRSLTDDRVRFERAPFDHPSLCVPVGHVKSAPGVPALDVLADSRVSALDRWALVPQTGRNGNPAPLQTFDELLAGTGRDGSRAHALEQSCVP